MTISKRWRSDGAEVDVDMMDGWMDGWMVLMWSAIEGMNARG